MFSTLFVAQPTEMPKILPMAAVTAMAKATTQADAQRRASHGCAAEPCTERAERTQAEQRQPGDRRHAQARRGRGE